MTVLGPMVCIGFRFILIAPGLCIVLSLLAACLNKIARKSSAAVRSWTDARWKFTLFTLLLSRSFANALSDDILYGTDKRWLLLSVLSVLFAVLLARVMARLTAKTQKQPTQQT